MSSTFKSSLLAMALGALLLAGACGGKKRPPPSPAQVRAGVRVVRARAARRRGANQRHRLPPVGRSPRIRILLKEGFSSVRIEGARLAPWVRAVSRRGRIRLLDRSGRRLKESSGFRLRAGRRVLKVDGRPYRGSLEVFINPLGRAVVVNELDMEGYLKGVVANELNPKAFPFLEAIKAQTIAARTYALSNLGQYARRGFDLYADQRSQVYGGVAREQRMSNRSVDETRGTIVVYHRRPVVAFYSSTCGGLTEDYQAVYRGPPIAYLRGGVHCPDDASPFHSWYKRVRISARQRELNQVARVGRLRKVKILKRSRSGRVLLARFEGSRGRRTLDGNQTRRVLGLRSNWITRLKSRRDRSGYLVELDVRGHGYGHGVGLCQMGAVEYARRGWSCARILKHYYTGVKVIRRW